MGAGPMLPIEFVNRRAPENLVDSDNHLFSHEYVRKLEAVTATRLQSVTVLPNGYVMGKYLPLRQGFSPGLSRLRYARNSLRAAAQLLRRRSAPSFLERGIFVTDEFSNGFFHWVCDVLPRVEVLSTDLPDELRSRTPVIPRMAHFPYVDESLRAFGTKDAMIVTDGNSLRCGDLLVLPAIAPTGNYRPATMDRLRTRFRRHFGAQAPSRRIFISRARAPKRRIAHEDSLQPVLDRFGFERVVLEELSLADQVRLVGSAAILGGGHGAGLAHMCWMAAGTRVLELRRAGDAENNCYFSLASALDIGYSYLLCDGENPKSDTHSGDIVVRPEKLERALAAMCGHPGAS